MKILIRNFFERLLAPFAWCISRVQINRTTFEQIDGEEFVLKKRTLISPVLIAVGNCVLSVRRVPVEVLHYDQWVRWEQQIQTMLASDPSQETAHGLFMQRKAGRPLAEMIKNETIEEDRVIAMILSALRELHRLHQLSVDVGNGADGQTCFFSHGDASVSNVLYDMESNQACWFDFDLRHDFRQPAKLRHADDLRAFLFTTMKCLNRRGGSEDLIVQCKEAMRVAYPDEQVWQSLEDITSSRSFAIDLFHRAQLFRLRG